jgi:hypothetical protein
VLAWSADGDLLLLAAGGLDTEGAILAVPWAQEEPPVVLVNKTFALRGSDASWQELRE